MIRNLLLAAILLAIGLAAYLPAMDGGPVWDDHLLLGQNPTVRGSTPVADAFLQPFTPFPVFYRPVTALVLRVGVRGPQQHDGEDSVHQGADREREPRDEPTTGWDLRWLHLFGILLHVGVAWGVAALARWAGAGASSASVAAVLFLIHPALSEAVAWMSGLGDLLAAFGLIVGAVLLLGFGKGRPTMGAMMVRGLLAPLFLGVALFSKESALLVPPLLLGTAWRSGGRSPSDRKILLTSCVATGLLFIAYFGLRAGAVGPWVSGGVVPDPVRALLALGSYTRLLFLPIDTDFQLLLDLHPLLDKPSGFDARYLWAALGGGLCIALLAWSALRRERPFFGLAWFVLTFFPGWLLVPPSSPILAERYLYIPCIGLAVALASLATKIQSGDGSLVNRRAARRAVRGGLLAVLFTTGVLAFGLTRSRASEWSSEETILERSLTRDARNIPIAVNRGFLLRSTGRMEETRALFDRTIRAVDAGPPVYLSGHGNTAWGRLLFEAATLALASGDDERAEQLFRRALDTDPTAEKPYTSLSALLGNQGRLEEVVALLLPAVEAHPRSVALRRNLARALSLLGRPDEATRQYRKILEIDPGNPEARFRLGGGDAP